MASVQTSGCHTMTYECERRGFMPRVDPNDERIVNYVEQHVDAPIRGVNANADDNHPCPYIQAYTFEVWHETHGNLVCSTVAELVSAFDWLDSLE